MMRFLSLQPMLQTEDMRGTQAWYASMLGFAVAASIEGEWCRLTRDGVSLMFMKNDHLGKPQATATQYFQVDDVMSLWASIAERCTAEWGPEEMRYGMLEFAVRDPNGYLLSFGQEIEAAGE